MSDLILFRPADFAPLSGCSVDASCDALAIPTNGEPSSATDEYQANALITDSSSKTSSKQPASKDGPSHHPKAYSGRAPTTLASMEAPRMLTDRQPKDICDMSVDGMSPPVMVIIHNGEARRQFDISRELLLAKGLELGVDNLADEIVRSITLHDINPDAFNLFTMWLYGYELPRVTIPVLDVNHLNNSWVNSPAQGQRSSSQSNNQFAEPSPLAVPVPGPIFTNTLQPDRKESLTMENFQHICFMDCYKHFSVEEIRLANLASAPTISSSSKSGETFTSSPTSSSAPNFSHSAEYVATGSLKRGSLPTEPPQTSKKAKTEDRHDQGNEKIQILLLELALLAHKHHWTQCFNLAVDAYRHGERELNRKLPRLDHIRLAYRNYITRNTPVALLMADYAFHKASQAGLTEFAYTVFLEKPLFMQDYVARLDGKVEVPGCKVFRGDDSGLRICTEPSSVYPSPSPRHAPLDDFNAEHYHMKF